MTETGAKSKTFRRRVIREEQIWVSQTVVTLSCEHTLYVRTYGRYSGCKTLSCPTCQADAAAMEKLNE